MIATRKTLTLLVLLPLTAAAQRIEVAALGGWYRPEPRALQGPTHIECDDVPCPYFFRETRAPSTMIGWRLTVELGPRFGIDAIWQRSTSDVTTTYAQSPGGTPIDQSTFEHAATFLALQPHIRFRLSEEVQAVVALGPAFADVATGRVESTASGGIWLALSGSLRGQLTRRVSLEVRASNTRLLGNRDTRNHLFAGAGLAFAWH